MSQYNYVVTACESASIIGILKVNLFNDGINRILAIRSRSFEVYEVEEDNLIIDDKVSIDEILDLSVLRKVGTVETYKDTLEFNVWHPKGQDFDDILIFTREYELIIFRAYILNSNREKILHFHILDNISLFRENLRKSELIKMMIHSEKQRIVVLAYEGCLQVIGCETLNKENEIITKFNSPLILRLSELIVTDICLVLTTNERSLLTILYDSGYTEDPRLIKIIELPLDLRKWSCNSTMGLTLSRQIFKIFPFYDKSKKYKTIRGFFLFGDGIVEYRSLEDILPNKSKNQDTTQNFQNPIKAYFSSGIFSGKDVGLNPLSIVDVISLEDNIRWLVFDNMGRLFIMLVQYEDQEKDKIIEIKVDLLNQYSPFSRIIQVSDHLFFLASKLSNSLLLYFYKNKIHILETIPNIGPIRDLLFAQNQIIGGFSTNIGNEELEKKNPMPLIAACGFGYTGGLKTIFNGISLKNLYLEKDTYINQITNLFSLNNSEYSMDYDDYIIITSIKETSCFKMKWVTEKNSKLNTKTNQENIQKENTQNIFVKDELKNNDSFKKTFLNLEKAELNGLEKNEETLKICVFKNKYWFQVTPSGLFSIGEISLNKKKWLLKDQLNFLQKNQHESILIEKFDYFSNEEIIIISTSNGFLIISKFDEENILEIIYYKTKQELIEIISQEVKNNERSFNFTDKNLSEFDDKNHENSLIFNSISNDMDEICILNLFVVKKFVLIFIGTWLNGRKLSCFYFENPNYKNLQEDLKFDILLNIDTEFKEYETLITTLKIFNLKKNVELINQKLVEKNFICLIIGTNNGYLQLQYISIEEIISNIEIRLNNKFDKNESIFNYFKQYNTWKASNYYISDIQELNIPENSNKQFFICCDRPKILFWNSTSGRGKPGIGTWTFFNIHSSWIPIICQVNIPKKPLRQNKCFDIKENKERKTFILYVSHEEKEDEEIQINQLKQNLNSFNDIFIRKKTNKQTLLKLSLIDTLQRYNLKSIPLEFTPEKVCYIENLKIYAIVGVIENHRESSIFKFSENIDNNNLSEKNFENEDNNDDLIFIQSVICLISAKDLKIHYSKILESNVYPTCMEYVNLRLSSDQNEFKSFLAIGMSKIDGLNENFNFSSDNINKNNDIGKVVLYDILNKNKSYELVEIARYNTEAAPFVLKEFRKTQLLVAVENSLISLELHSIPPSINLSSSSSSLSENIWMEGDYEYKHIELRRKEAYNTHTMIVFIKTWNDEFLLVGDLMRSVGLWEFDRNTAKFYEICRDSSIAWVIEGIFLNKNMYLISDENKNIRILMKSLEPENDETNTSLSCIAHYHVGESITTFQRGKFMLAYPEVKQNNLDYIEENICKYMFEEQIVFGTSQGGIYIIFNMKNDANIYTRLVLIEEAIINALQKVLSKLNIRKKIVHLQDSDIKKLFIKSSTSSSFTGISCILGGKGSIPFRWILNSTKESYNFEYDCTGYPRGFVCGDIIESFLDFSTELQELVISELKDFKTNDKINLPENNQQLEMIVEQLRNMH